MSWKYNRITLVFSEVRFHLLKRFYTKIVVGASGYAPLGYLKTEQKYFDVELPYPINNLKEIIADSVWEHLDFPSIATKNAYDALRVGGSLLIAVPLEETEEQYKKNGHKHRFTESQLREMFTKSGFKKIHLFARDKRIRRKINLIVEGIK